MSDTKTGPAERTYDALHHRRYVQTFYADAALAEKDSRIAELEAELAALKARIDDHEAVARTFHEAYERMAPDFSYSTRKASAVPWEQVPENNRRLMVAAAGAVARWTERGQS